MRKFYSFFSASAACIVLLGSLVVFLVSCANSTCSTCSTVDSVGVVSVDFLLNNTDSIIGKKVTVKGLCSEFGKTAPRRAFIQGSADSIYIECHATAVLGGKFDKSLIGDTILVTGLLQERRIDEFYLKQLERRFHTGRAELLERQERDSNEKDMARLAGFPDISVNTEHPDSTFAKAMADYRSAIKKRLDSEGKNYYSVYYIDAVEVATAN